MKIRKISYLLVLALLITSISLILTGCGTDNSGSNDTSNTDSVITTPGNNSQDATSVADPNVTSSAGTISAEASESQPVTNAPDDTTTGGEAANEYDYKLVFASTKISYTDRDSFRVEDGTEQKYVLIKSGVYHISGTLTSGTIVVDVPKTEKVTLMLDNFTGTSYTSAVIYVRSADEVYIDLVKGTVNTLTDAKQYVYASADETKPNACVYSSDDLTIKGGGTLIVNANYNNGIGCKNDIVIKNGHITVNAIKNAIKGEDSITVKGDADIKITACNDGLKSDSLDVGKGFIMITEDATVLITGEDDALQASQLVTITSGASVTVNVAGDSVNCDGTVNIAEGSLNTAN